jgi:hypothetical protein
MLGLKVEGYTESTNAISAEELACAKALGQEKRVISRKLKEAVAEGMKERS